mmetsp:Transcript_9916/g.29780  ORF Transcript_9916/g.29780 Transcript_9916/m.29780 type:complete len:297 (+) Transcript_9916:2186-3076(+)
MSWRSGRPGGRRAPRPTPSLLRRKLPATGLPWPLPWDRLRLSCRPCPDLGGISRTDGTTTKHRWQWRWPSLSHKPRWMALAAPSTWPPPRPQRASPSQAWLAWASPRLGLHSGRHQDLLRGPRQLRASGPRRLVRRRSGVRGWVPRVPHRGKPCCLLSGARPLAAPQRQQRRVRGVTVRCRHGRWRTARRARRGSRCCCFRLGSGNIDRAVIISHWPVSGCALWSSSSGVDSCDIIQKPSGRFRLVRRVSRRKCTWPLEHQGALCDRQVSRQHAVPTCSTQLSKAFIKGCCPCKSQ